MDGKGYLYPVYVPICSRFGSPVTGTQTREATGSRGGKYGTGCGGGGNDFRTVDKFI